MSLQLPDNVVRYPSGEVKLDVKRHFRDGEMWLMVFCFTTHTSMIGTTPIFLRVLIYDTKFPLGTPMRELAKHAYNVCEMIGIANDCEYRLRRKIQGGQLKKEKAKWLPQPTKP